MSGHALAVAKVEKKFVAAKEMLIELIAYQGQSLRQGYTME